MIRLLLGAGREEVQASAARTESSWESLLGEWVGVQVPVRREQTLRDFALKTIGEDSAYPPAVSVRGACPANASCARNVPGPAMRSVVPEISPLQTHQKPGAKANTGTMAGPAARPSGKPPENRTAAQTDFQPSSLDWRAGLKALQRAERRQLQSAHAAGYAMLRASDAAKASTLAHAEIALAFAHRWAEIRRGPAALRAAAAAALQAEQTAALAARVNELVGQASDQQRVTRAQLGARFQGERRAMSRRHRDTWAAAAATAVARVKLPGAPSSPPPRSRAAGAPVHHS